MISISRNKDIFRKDENIYINRSIEQIHPHEHKHEFIEIAYVAAGNGIHIINNKKYNVSKGDLFLINSNIGHEFRSIENLPGIVIYNCIFTPDFIDLSLDSKSNLLEIVETLMSKSLFPEDLRPEPDIKLLKEETSVIYELYKKMYKEYQLALPGYIEVLRANILELLIQIFRVYTKKNKDKTPYSKTVIDSILSYMKINYNKNINFEELSQKSFISHNYLCVLFKKATSMTMTEYIQHLRIEKACEMLLKSNKKIITISNETGYSDIKFFNKLFKKITGKTPTEFKS